MFRFRRYRVFLVFATFTVVLLYHFTNVRRWPDTPIRGGRPRVQEQLTSTAPIAPLVTRLAKQSLPTATKKQSSDSSTTVAKQSLGLSTTVETRPAVQSIPVIQQQAASPIADGSQRTIAPQFGANAVPLPVTIGGGIVQEGKGRQEVSPAPTDLATIHWTKMSEHFPVPTESIIPLPSGPPQPIPKIQYNFKDESSDDRRDREKKLSDIKDAFNHAWTGYKTHAWLHDELSPVSGFYRDPFNGWAATLVDTLDTLWIMDMEEDFQKASLAIGEIDFTTTVRDDIPLFETTIRYLGGLLSAYDLSGGKYKVLLAKAIELGEVLMGAFDTPNRMPVTYYNWMPTFTSQPHRAGTRVILAELGSLAMEFTRLAQITGQAKYYDAIARITNELDAWQNKTDIPGLWPRVVDASGCKKPAKMLTTQTEQSLLSGPDASQLSIVPVASNSSKYEDLAQTQSSKQKSLEEEHITPVDADKSTKVSDPELISKEVTEQSKLALNKRQISFEGSEGYTDEMGTIGTPKYSQAADEAGTPTVQAPLSETSDLVDKVTCEPQGFTSPPKTDMQEFTLGGEADSTFEYLPKQHLLLGGTTSQYRKMYESAMDAATKYLLFRPMVPDNRDILVAGTASTSGDPDIPGNLHFTPDQGHLTCFTGGMYAIGAKIFNRAADLEIAKKLTEGCVWAYNATATGVMPEGFHMIPCESREKCEWNETLWYDILDPHEEDSGRDAKVFEDHGRKVWEGEHRRATSKDQDSSKNTLESSPPATLPVVDNPSLVADTLVRRQIGHIENDPPLLGSVAAPLAKQDKGDQPMEVDVEVDDATASTRTSHAAAESYTPEPIPSHKEFAEELARRERLPVGIPKITSRKYILRPEAIESVFIMYRITGDETWRKKGWKMFTAIQNLTKVEFGNSGVTDATSPVPNYDDIMESFWLAETLKYFYLLFKTPNFISLDEYVFTTEAHPFKRPQA